jgi:hypothetical protein
MDKEAYMTRALDAGASFADAVFGCVALLCVERESAWYRLPAAQRERMFIEAAEDALAALEIVCRQRQQQPRAER